MHLKYKKTVGLRGYAPDTAVELTTLPRSPSWWGGADLGPENPPPPSAIRASQRGPY